MPSTIDSSLSTVSAGSRFGFRRGGGAPRRRMTASEEAEIVSLATKQAVSAAVSIIKAGGTQTTALSTATAAAKSVLLPSKHEVPSNKDFLNRKKLKRHVEVIASLALTSAMNMAHHSDSSMMMHENVQVDVADMLMNGGSRSVGPDHLIYTQTAGGDSFSQLSTSIMGATQTGSVAPFSQRSRVQTPSVISRVQTPSTQPPISHPAPSPEPSKRGIASPESIVQEEPGLSTLPILSFLKTRQSAASPETSKGGTVSPETVQEAPSISLPILNFLRPQSSLKPGPSKDEANPIEQLQQQAQTPLHQLREMENMTPAHVLATSHSNDTPERIVDRERSIPRIPSNKSDVSAFIDYFRKKREREVQKKPNASSSVRDTESSKIPTQMPMPRSQVSRASGIIKSLDKDQKGHGGLENKTANGKHVRSVMSEESSYGTESNGGTYNVDEEYTYEESFYSTEDETLDDNNSYEPRPRDATLEDTGDGKGVLSGFADLLTFALNCGPEPPCTRPPTPVPSKTRNQPQAFKPYRNSSPEHYEQRDDSSDFRDRESASTGSSADSSEIIRELNCNSEESDIIRSKKPSSSANKKESVSSLVLRVLSEAVPTSPAHAQTQPSSYSSPQRPRLLIPPNEQESHIQTSNEFTNESKRFQTRTRSSSSRKNFDDVQSQLQQAETARYSANTADVIIQQSTSPSDKRSQHTTSEEKSKKKRFGWGRKSKKMTSATPADF
jgi:hypothetical protein